MREQKDKTNLWKWYGNKSFTWHRIQSNGHKDTPQTWEKNGRTQWEVPQRVRQCKKEPIRASGYSNWNKKNRLEGINSRLDDEEEWISDLEDRVVEITQAEQKKKKRVKTNRIGLRDLWDNIEHPNIPSTLTSWVPEGEEREGVENLFEVKMAKNVPNLGKEIEV